MKRFMAFLISILAVITMLGAGPFRGRLVDYRNKPIKSAKIYAHDSKNYVKPDKEGRFLIENISPGDTIYVKWRGQVYDILVYTLKGMNIKFDREPMAVEYADMGILGRVRDSYNGHSQRFMPVTTALEIMNEAARVEISDMDDDDVHDAMTFSTEPIRGTLYDYKGKPIKNAKVFTHNPKKCVKTDKNGNFAIYEALTNDTIYVKWKGSYYDIPIEGKSVVMKFSKDYPKHRDFVDTGKGLIDARYYNGPRDVRTAKQLEATGQSDLIQALNNISGVRVYYDKKGKSKISIRNGGDPLWIVDGVEMTEYPGLMVIEVERVEILKDGFDYGTRGMNGVIVVTTKGSGFIGPDSDDE